MSLDLTALLAAQRAIKVAKASYDFARDGGAQGSHAISSETIPAGSLIIGTVQYTTTGLIFATTGAMNIQIGNTFLNTPDSTINRIKAALLTGGSALVTDTERALSVFIYNDACSAGAFTIWVLYLPLVD